VTPSGLTVIDDRSSFGQRATFTGTTIAIIAPPLGDCYRVTPFWEFSVIRVFSFCPQRALAEASWVKGFAAISAGVRDLLPRTR
jgi:hypothetical protein